MMNQDPYSVRYGVDSNDRICCVYENWTSFAEANGAPELTPVFVIGKPIWSFFRGQETIELTRVIFDKVRRTGAGFVIPFRCDSADVLRPMVMLLTPGQGGAIEISTRSVPAHLAQFSTDPVPLTQRVGDMLKVCAWCCRIELLSKIWVEAELALGDMSVLSTAAVPPVSHGICPECFDVVRANAFA